MIPIPIEHTTRPSQYFSTEAEIDALAQLCKALAHPARIRIVQELWRLQSCIGCELVDSLGLAQSTTSEHLRILKQAGIIHGEIEHPRVCYRLSPQALLPLQAWLSVLDQTPA